MRRNRRENMTLLVVNLLEKMDLVSKNVNKRGKMVDFEWSLVILTFLLTAAILSQFSHGLNSTCVC
jgi:hypothetical protein